MPRARGLTAPTAVGLFLALFGPLIVAAVSIRYAALPASLATSVAWLFVLIALLAAVLAIVRYGERRPWSFLGFRRPAWQTFAWALAFAAFFVFVYGPLTAGLFASLDSRGFEPGIASTASLPLWYLVLLICIVGSMEEILPMWGWILSLTFVVTGGIFAAFYLWRRDIIANMLAHVLVDIVGIALSQAR